jgi:integrase
MAGKQAKILTRQQIVAAPRRARRGRYPQRDRVMILLSVKAGLRAGEIANLTWPMVLDADGHIANHIELHDRAAKKRSGRIIPLHPLTACVTPRQQPEPAAVTSRDKVP